MTPAPATAASSKSCQLVALCDSGLDWWAVLQLIFAISAWLGFWAALYICYRIYKETL